MGGGGFGATGVVHHVIQFWEWADALRQQIPRQTQQRRQGRKLPQEIMPTRRMRAVKTVSLYLYLYFLSSRAGKKFPPLSHRCHPATCRSDCFAVKLASIHHVHAVQRV